MKCKHLNGTLFEEMTAVHQREVVDGILDEIGYNNVGNITGYTYSCNDCGKNFHYVAGISLKLKWLKRIHDQFGSAV